MITCVVLVALSFSHETPLEFAIVSDDGSNVLVPLSRLTFLDQDDILVVECVPEILFPVQALPGMYSQITHHRDSIYSRLKTLSDLK